MQQALHPVQALFQRLERFRYPAGVTGTWALVEGPEFFPGGCGLWNAERNSPWPELEPGGVIVLGHNLDSVDSYKRNLATGGLRRGPTWSNLRKLLDAAEVDVRSCFLTNFFMGVGPNQRGYFAGAKDTVFVEDCLEFLHETIRQLQPRAVLVLGQYTRPYLAGLSPALAAWQTVRTYAELDDRMLAVVPDVAVDGAGKFGVVTVVHPSGATMGGNQKKRRFEGLEGIEAEAASLRRALAR